MKKLYIISFVSFALILSLVGLYYKSLQQKIPENIVQSTETIMNVDKIRFTFKIGSLTKRSLATYLLALKEKDNDKVDESLEYLEAAIGFTTIKYTKDQTTLDVVIPRLESSIALISRKQLNISSEELNIVIRNNSEINDFVEERERLIWKGLQKDYINFRTDEVEKSNIQKTLSLIIVLTTILIVVLFLIRHFEKGKLSKEINVMNDEYSQLEKRFILAADKALAGYWEWDLDSNYLYLSKGWKRFLGYEDSELENNFKTFESLLHADDLEITMNMVNQHIEGKSKIYNTKFRLKHKDGSYKWISAIGTFDSTAKIFFGFHIDIDDLTTTKETLIAQSKSAIMGEMIGLIAHQLKQPLSVISMTASNQLASISLEEEITNNMLEKDAHEVLKQILHLSETIDTFKDFLKLEGKRINTTIESILESSLNIMEKSLINNDIEIIKDFKDTAEIKVFGSELMQVFINLINNAKDAFKINNIDKRVIILSTFQKENNVIVTIEDTAGGIPLDKIDNIFDAYFTTKEQEGGSGLGLYIVKTILEEHLNASIDVSNTNEGVKFTIAIPIQ